MLETSRYALVAEFPLRKGERLPLGGTRLPPTPSPRAAALKPAVSRSTLYEILLQVHFQLNLPAAR
ncbi:MAG: hypothetical protein J5647_02095, partial [Spirochaetaceae bacterium]|nr:hypothetical protein [Spirochaetaceae bacterium]